MNIYMPISNQQSYC